MKTGRALLAAVAVASIVGGGMFIAREGRVRECRQAVTMAATPIGGASEMRAALALAVDIHRRKVRECYEAGLLETPQG